MEGKPELAEKADAAIVAWIRANALRRKCTCPACTLSAAITGETVGRGPIRINESEGTIRREVRVLPTLFRCPFCKLELNGFQEMKEAGLGTIYTNEEDEDPIELFGIIPEEHVDIDALLREYGESEGADYLNGRLHSFPAFAWKSWAASSSAGPRRSE